jgi:hypothetical protein
VKGHWFSESSALALIVVTVTWQPGFAQDATFGDYSHVANTHQVDDFLALRTEPSLQKCVHFTTMPSGTLLEVLARRPDRWWYVRLLPFGQEGWASSERGTRTWIECCRTGLTDPRPIPTPDEPVGFKTPSGNTYCQIDERALRCDLKEMTTRPRRPSDCDLEWGDAFVIEHDGRSGYRYATAARLPMTSWCRFPTGAHGTRRDIPASWNRPG